MILRYATGVPNVVIVREQKERVPGQPLLIESSEEFLILGKLSLRSFLVKDAQFGPVSLQAREKFIPGKERSQFLGDVTRYVEFIEMSRLLANAV